MGSAGHCDARKQPAEWCCNGLPGKCARAACHICQAAARLSMSARAHTHEYHTNACFAAPLLPSPCVPNPHRWCHVVRHKLQSQNAMGPAAAMHDAEPSPLPAQAAQRSRPQVLAFSPPHMYGSHDNSLAHEACGIPAQQVR